MSRHTVTEEPLRVVGWDPPLQTFFAQEFGRGAGAPATWWVGLLPREFYDLEDLRRALPVEFRLRLSPQLERVLYADRDEGR